MQISCEFREVIAIGPNTTAGAIKLQLRDGRFELNKLPPTHYLCNKMAIIIKCSVLGAISV